MEGVEADDRALTSTQHQPICVELHGTANEHLTFAGLIAPRGLLKQDYLPNHNYGQTSAPATNFSSEPGIEESVRAGITTSSGLHAGAGSLASHCNANKSLELPATSWNVQRQFLSLNWQVRELGILKEISAYTQVQAACPPTDAKARNQLLPRYRPRITEQELQSLTRKNSNSIVTPLFEKVLSASDAGKVGRLVLPKACAEVYFPPISEPEGIPLIVQDVGGREWTLQFRFWLNNNSRMYVLEGVTPCIQSMNLQAGDTVIFSRIDPEGKLVISFRRAPRVINTGGFDGVETLPATSEKLASPNTNDNGFRLYMMEKIDPQSNEETSHIDLITVNDKRKAKEMSTKNKRQQQDAEREFRKNWEDAQNLLQSPLNVAPTIVTIEGYEFEEYEDPPVLGTQIVSTDCLIRHTHQGIEEAKAGVCSGPGKGQFLPLLEREKEAIAEPLRQMIMEPSKTSRASCGLQTLATLVATQVCDNDESAATPAVEPTTTKHPRHRLGCTCIVCIQPPSGKGPKHKPNCECTVCSTVKRRFQTLMLRRKKEKEAEMVAVQRNQLVATMDVGMNGVKRRADMDGNMDGSRVPVAFSSVGTVAQRVVRDYECRLTSPGDYLDLNSHPTREEDIKRAALLMKFTGSDAYGLDVYLRERGLASLRWHKQVPVASNSVITHRQDHDSSHSMEVLSSDGTDIVAAFNQAAD